MKKYLLPLAVAVTIVGGIRLVNRIRAEPHEMMSYTIIGEPEEGTVAVELDGITLLFEGIRPKKPRKERLTFTEEFPIAGTSWKAGAYYGYFGGRPPLLHYVYDDDDATVRIADKHEFQVRDKGTTLTFAGQSFQLDKENPPLVRVSEDGSIIDE